MNLNQDKYKQFFLVKEMLESIDIVKNFDPEVSKGFVPFLENMDRVLLTGEGSSRIFPAKRLIYSMMQKYADKDYFTEGATQAMEYFLEKTAVFGASNSGKTKEVIQLFGKLKSKNHPSLLGLTAYADTPLSTLAQKTHVLTCGKEESVAATKSVLEQALFYDSLVHHLMGQQMTGLDGAASDIETVLTQEINPEWTAMIKDAPIIYFAGRNNGVAEELTLKTNEITRKKSDYLEGTYIVHGIEEVMNKNEAVILIEPYQDEEEKIKECLVDNVGVNVFAISHRQTIFPTMIIPKNEHYANYIELAAGWNILVEVGLALGIDLDKPNRARKVGNEFIFTK